MRRLVSFALLFIAWSVSASAVCELSPQRRVVLLKLDDVVGVAQTGVSPRWQQVTEFLESNHIAASYGIIGESLAPENEAYFAWLKARVDAGFIEFWNHGYRFRFDAAAAQARGEFDGTTAAAQGESIRQTQTLAQQRIGVALRGFGPHASAVDQHTFVLLDEQSEIDYVWFYKPVDQGMHRPYVIERRVELEAPIFHPKFEAFRKRIDRATGTDDYVALQGHPNEWDEVGFAAFQRIVQWLRQSGASFCRPSDLTAAGEWEKRSTIFHEESR